MKSKSNKEVHRLSIGVIYRNVTPDNRKPYSMTYIKIYNILININNNDA